MSTEPAPAARGEKAAQGCPWVGPRPYDAAEKPLFFGREKDANFICDKIFSSRLTLLHAASGVGKSSVLRVLVVPKLAEDQALPIYFDAWGSDDPVGALKAALADAARSVGVVDPGRGAPTLAELLRLMNAVDDRTIVLILDQFDEFLVASRDLHLLRRELGEAVRSGGPDVRVLISLRQELLASLESFRDGLLDPFASTYQLEPLAEEGVRQAVLKPAAASGTPCEPELAEALVRDLATSEARLRSGGRVVELPMLQIVCSGLWRDARRSGAAELTVRRYNQIGGAKKLLAAYVNGVMPKEFWKQGTTARLLIHLAPPSGMKMSFTADDLAAFARMRKPKVQGVVKALKSKQLLRSRVYRGTERIELQHDALIKIIGPWRNRVLSVRKWLRRLIVGWAVLLAASLGLEILLQAQLERDLNTERVLSDACGERPSADSLPAEVAFDRAAHFLLFREKGPGRLDALRALFLRHQRCLPASYGVWRSDPDPEGLSPGGDWSQRDDSSSEGDADAEAPEAGHTQGGESPFAVYYSSERKFDAGTFNATWRRLARALSEESGIPVPRRVVFAQSGHLPGREIEVVAPGLTDRFLDIEEYSDSALINAADLRGNDPANEFFKHFPREWRPFDRASGGGPWWIVPRWSLPVWKITGVRSEGETAIAARVAMSHLAGRPEVLLNAQAVAALLARAKQVAPATVREANGARADLRTDLIEVFKTRHSLDRLPEILEALSMYRADPPGRIYAHVVEYLADPDASPPAADGRNFAVKTGRSSGVKVASWHGDGARAAAAAYKEAAGLLPPMTESIHVELGAELGARWVEQEDWTPEREQELEDLRTNLFQQYGVVMPAVVVRPSREESLPPLAFRIAGHDGSGAVLSRADPDAAWAALTQWLTAEVQRWRIRSINAEVVEAALDQLPEGTSAWLRARYTGTELKLLLREIAAQPRDRGGRATAPPASAGAASQLFESLVFWTAPGPKLRRDALVKDLRRTAAALKAPAAGPGRAPMEGVQAGLSALAQGDPARAQAAFATALQADANLAASDFLSAYVPQVRFEALRTAVDKCNLRRLGALSLRHMASVLELLQLGVSPWNRRMLELCVLNSVGPAKARQLTLEILRSRGPADGWAEQDATFFGYYLLEQLTAGSPDPELLEASRELLASAAGRSEPSARDVFARVEGTCDGATPAASCWKVAEAVAAARPGELGLEWASILGRREHREYAEQALRLASASAEEPEAQLTRANALRSLALRGDRERGREAEELYRGVLSSKYAQEAYGGLAELLVARDERAAAELLLKEGLEKWPGDPKLLLVQLDAALGAGDRAQVAAVGDAAMAAMGERTDLATRGALLFVASVAQILTDGPEREHIARRFLLTHHDDMHYVALLLSTFANAESRDDSLQELKQLWAAERTMDLKRRLRSGDDRAWRQMLIGYALGHLEASDLFDPVASEEAFSAAGLRELEGTREGMLTDALLYDACLAKKRGDLARMKASLQRIEDTHYRRNTEFWIARYLAKTAG